MKPHKDVGYTSLWSGLCDNLYDGLHGDLRESLWDILRVSLWDSLRASLDIPAQEFTKKKP